MNAKKGGECSDGNILKQKNIQEKVNNKWI